MPTSYLPFDCLLCITPLFYYHTTPFIVPPPPLLDCHLQFTVPAMYFIPTAFPLFFCLLRYFVPPPFYMGQVLPAVLPAVICTVSVVCSLPACRSWDLHTAPHAMNTDCCVWAVPHIPHHLTCSASFELPVPFITHATFLNMLLLNIFCFNSDCVLVLFPIPKITTITQILPKLFLPPARHLIPVPHTPPRHGVPLVIVPQHTCFPIHVTTFCQR